MFQTSTRFDRFLTAAVLILLVLLPLPLGSNRDWSMGLLVALTGLLAFLFSVALFLNALPASKALKPALPMLGLLLAAQAWVAVQWLGGLTVDVGATVQYLLLGIAYSLLFLMVVSLFRTRKRLTWLLGALVVSGTFQAFYGAFMTLSGVEWLLATAKTSYTGDATGTFVNRNHLAGYLEITLACGIGLLMALRDGRPFRWVNLLEMLMGAKARLRLALVVMVIALVMTHSRGGNAAFFTALMVIGGIFVLRDKDNRLRNSLILASILLIDVLVISQYFGLERLKDRMLNTRLNDVVVSGEVVQQANEIRDDVFRYAIPLAQDKPLIGQGAGSFESVFPKYPGEDIRLHFDHAHNDYLQFAIEYGLLGCLPLLAFVLLALWQALQALWRRESLYRSGVGFGAAMGIIAIAIHSLTDFNLQIPANAATLVVLCAIAVLANQHSNPRRKASLGE
ncbi:O-antigen ligase family protein [Pseudomonas sp. MAP12]|uniref:O-antigen ligase family protein n=1 Tax=Geopseudomonas aromaticivorans TaxID=2849492 RepID=A0ABS6MVV8_9GAMM|nr:O-antigen ligase family protein [Pseudomonas aromaticivorans]MBV2132939.1 O-antigen ligase family protein [Pseudomonas aromaticivorans]